MELCRFYFIHDVYFKEFNDPHLMGNHKRNGNRIHNRPYFFSLIDEETGLLWMIPVSSKVEKYEIIYQHKIKRNGRCDTLYFGNVLGYKKAFLLQNMCPINERYIQNIYLNSNHEPVLLDRKTEIELVAKAKFVLGLHKRGYDIIFPNVRLIESKLLDEKLSNF